MELFEKGLLYASKKHASQLRKSSKTPFILHPLAVASIVLESGGTEVEATAALLHDVVEDQGGQEAYEEILSLFGKEVATIVADCTDAWETPKPPWKERKIASLTHLQTASSSTLLVYAADKLHNVRSIIAEYPLLKEETWDVFKTGKDGTLWYYNSMLEVFRGKVPFVLFYQLEKVVEELNGLG